MKAPDKKSKKKVNYINKKIIKRSTYCLRTNEFKKTNKAKLEASEEEWVNYENHSGDLIIA